MRNKEMHDEKCVIKYLKSFLYCTRQYVKNFREFPFWILLRANQLNSFYIWNIWMNTAFFLKSIPQRLFNFKTFKRTALILQEDKWITLSFKTLWTSLSKRKENIKPHLQSIKRIYNIYPVDKKPSKSTVKTLEKERKYVQN